MKIRSISSKLVSSVLSLAMLFSMLWIISGAAVIQADAMYKSEFEQRMVELQKKYPDYSTWDDSFEGGIQCLGFAHLIGYETFGISPSKWDVSYSLKDVKRGDILRYGQSNGRGHSIFVMDVNGDYITFAECNGAAGYLKVEWGLQTTISSNRCYSHTFLYRLVAPPVYEDIHNNGSYYQVIGTNNSGTKKITLNTGTKMTFYAKFADGEGAKSYKCLIKKTTDKNWTVVQNYSSKSSFTVTNNTVGSYAVKLIAKDKNNHSANVNFFYDVISKPLANNGSYIQWKNRTENSDTSLDVLKGSKIVINPSFIGGYGNLRYKYMYKKTTDSSWTVLHDYDAKAESWEVELPYLGSYVIKVIARDAKSNAVSADIRCNTKKSLLKDNGCSASCNIIPISNKKSFSVYQNVPVTYFASFIDGYGKLQYKFEYKRSSETKWTVQRDFSAAKSFSLRLQKTGSYDMMITAKDETGKTATSSFTCKIISAPLKENGSYLLYNDTKYTSNSIKITEYDSIYIYPQFRNNGKKFRMKAYIKYVGHGDYEEIEDPFWYDYEWNETTWEYKEIPVLYHFFDEAGRYCIKIIATDDYGNTVSKVFTVNVKEYTYDYDEY